MMMKKMIATVIYLVINLYQALCKTIFVHPHSSQSSNNVVGYI